jgi:hypothetical protein
LAAAATTTTTTLPHNYTGRTHLIPDTIEYKAEHIKQDGGNN